MAATDKDLAVGELVDTQTILPLLAGNLDVLTEEGILDTGDLAKYTVVGKLWATGKLVALDPDHVTAGDPEADPPIPESLADGSEVAYGILTQAADATAADQKVGVYIGGLFNDVALVWPESLDTLVKRQAVFTGTRIRIGTVRL